MNTISRRKFITITTGGIALATYGGNLLGTARAATSGASGPDFSSVGKKFRFAIIADPHIGPKNGDHPGSVASNAGVTLPQAVAEINAMDPALAFVIHIGDMCTVANPPSIAHWEECMAPVKPPMVMVHGNHDGKPPYDIYLEVQQKVSGYRAPFYSFDCGNWHFVSIPCNLNGEHPEEVEMEKQMLAFLESDLEKAKDRPTVILHHYHFLPVGLSQTEWYFYKLDTRKRLQDLYTRYGNVKWAFNGHVHNGIMASEKTSWNYRGINFINCPTVTAERAYDEEYPGYEKGLDMGGYYVVAEIDGNDFTLSGRLAGNPEPHPYPAKLQEFKEEIEPRLFRTLGELPVLPALANGDFSQGLSQWQLPQRYMRAEKPAYVANVVDDGGAPNGKALAIATIPTGSLPWAHDEYYEAYQISSLDAIKSPLVSLSYKLNQPPTDGGGYVRMEFLRDTKFMALMMFYWGVHDEVSSFYPHCVGYALTGINQNEHYLSEIGQSKQGFFWRLPMVAGKWHSLAVNAASLYGQALNDSGAFAKAQPNKINLALGTWNDKEGGTQSEALFSGITVKQASEDAPSHLDGQTLAYTPAASTIDFGGEKEGGGGKKRKNKDASA